MKVNITVECTPEEARGFLGLPDVSRVQEVYVDKVSKMVGDSVGTDAVSDLVKSWSNLGGSGLNIASQLLGPIAAGLAQADARRERRQNRESEASEGR